MSGQANHQEASIGSPATAVWADSNLLLGSGRCGKAVPERLTRVSKLLKPNALALAQSGSRCEKVPSGESERRTEQLTSETFEAAAYLGVWSR